MDLIKAASGGLLDIIGVSRLMGVKPKTIYSWVHTRQIPFVKIGRLVKFDPEDIAVWIQSKKVKIVEI